VRGRGGGDVSKTVIQSKMSRVPKQYMYMEAIFPPIMIYSQDPITGHPITGKSRYPNANLSGYRKYKVTNIWTGYQKYKVTDIRNGYRS
jgi:hypothetical protein